MDMVRFVEMCKILTINIFWVLAALFQIIAVLILVLGLLSNLINRGKNEENNE